MLTERYIRSFDGTEIFVSETGAGFPFVLCDGLGCAGFVWRHLQTAFAPRHRILHWHYRAHGLSQPPRDPGAMTVSDLCGDLLAVLDGMDTGKVVLLGHSMGVQLILEFAVRHPDRVAALVPMCGSYGRPLWTFHDRQRAAELFPIIKSVAERFPRVAQSIWKNLLTTELAYQFGVHVELNPHLVKREDFWPYFEALAAMDVQLFLRLLEDLNSHTVEDRLHLIRAPTLVVGGENDKFTPAWLSARMADLIPDAELLMVPSGTHTAPIELPELVHLRLERFLEDRVLPEGKPPGPASRQSKRTRAAGAAPGAAQKGRVEKDGRGGGAAQVGSRSAKSASKKKSTQKTGQAREPSSARSARRATRAR